MAPWAFMRVNFVPVTLGVLFSLGLITCFVIALAEGHVTPYMPFISETGGNFPEAGIFSMFLYFSATIGLSTMFVRYIIVDELNRGIDRSMDILNRISVVIGFIALMGMIVVAAYPMTSVPQAHNIGANILFLGSVIYAILQTWLSYKMSPYYNGLTICHIRVVITVLSGLALTSLTKPMGDYLWSTNSNQHWSGKKTPNDKGYGHLYEAYTYSISNFHFACLDKSPLCGEEWHEISMQNGRFFVLAVGPLAMSAWGSAPHSHWTGNKVPGDKGFDLMVASAVAEWVMAILFLAYYFTFIREFGKVCIHLRVQLLVQHFDEDPHDPNVYVATERTPIVM